MGAAVDDGSVDYLRTYSPLRNKRQEERFDENYSVCIMSWSYFQYKNTLAPCGRSGQCFGFLVLWFFNAMTEWI